MSEDHVPPKGAMPAKAVYVERTLGALCSGLQAPRPDFSQNGLKYRTLCARCNSKIGKHFDPALTDFAAMARRLVECKLFLPEKVDVRLRPAAVIRGVLAHLLAARLSEEDAGFDQAARALFFDHSLAIPDDVNVFYFVHRYPQVVVLRDVVMPARRGRFGDFGFFSILKFYPIGFIVSDLPSYEGLFSLTASREEKLGAYRDFPLRLTDSRPADWPENCEGRNIIAFGAEGMESVRAKLRVTSRT